MTKSEGWAVAFIFAVVALVIFGAVIVADMQAEKTRNLQNHGTARIMTPTYYVDPRVKKCFARFVNGSTATVKCDDLVKSLMANDWINKED